jgi:hypothetical protein
LWNPLSSIDVTAIRARQTTGLWACRTRARRANTSGNGAASARCAQARATAGDSRVSTRLAGHGFSRDKQSRREASSSKLREFSSEGSRNAFDFL